MSVEDYPSRIGPFEFTGVREMLSVVAVLAPLALALRALVVSHFDYSIAETLVSSTGTGTFLAVALVGIVPGFSYGAAVAIAYVVGRDRSKAEKAARQNHAAALVVVVLLMAPQVLASTVLLAAAEIVTVPVVYLLGRYEWPPYRGLRDILALALALYLVAVALPLRMWVPAEQAIVNGVLQTVYVIDESGDHATVFLPERVAVTLVPETSLGGRQLCAEGDRRSVGERLLGAAEQGMPECPGN